MHYAFLCLLRLSHDLQAFLNVLMHVDMFSGMYTSQGSGDIPVRMCGSWEKIMEDQRTSRRILKQVKQCIIPFYASLRLSHDLQAFLNVLIHVHMFMIFSLLPHMRTRISPDPGLVYIPLNMSTCIITFKKACRSCESCKSHKKA